MAGGGGGDGRLNTVPEVLEKVVPGFLAMLSPSFLSLLTLSTSDLLHGTTSQMVLISVCASSKANTQCLFASMENIAHVSENDSQQNNFSLDCFMRMCNKNERQFSIK